MGLKYGPEAVRQAAGRLETEDANYDGTSNPDEVRTLPPRHLSACL